VLAYAPSQHAKRAVMACRAAYDVREELGDHWTEMIVECARYAAESRQPWSEPPILEPPEPLDGSLDELRAGDLLRGERWLSARLEDAEVALREIVHGDALLMLDTAVALLPLLGEKGRYALLRMPVWELVADPDARDEDAPLEMLIRRAVESNGSIETVQAVFVALVAGGAAGFSPPSSSSGGLKPAAPLVPYRLARDYAQTLIAHALAPHHPQLLNAVHHNLEHGESYADWSFA